jgi:hypothetical protein
LADGIHFHGGHKIALVEDCEISYTGDDLYAVWQQAKFRVRINNSHDLRDCTDQSAMASGGPHVLASLAQPKKSLAAAKTASTKEVFNHWDMLLALGCRLKHIP